MIAAAAARCTLVFIESLIAENWPTLSELDAHGEIRESVVDTSMSISLANKCKIVLTRAAKMCASQTLIFRQRPAQLLRSWVFWSLIINNPEKCKT